MTTVRHVSQCSSLRYSFSFSFSHKCPGLVVASSRLQSDALWENAHHLADYSSAQWAVITLVRYATRTILTESCVSTGHQGKAFHRCQQTYQYVVGSTTVVTNTQPCWANATFCYPVSLDLGVNAVDHTVPSNNTGVTLNAYVWSCSTPSFSSPSFSSPATSTPATSSVIFQSCKFQSCKFSYPISRDNDFRT